ncbi:MAG: hypothetical protein ACE5G6_00270 [Terriglobia bacterium]
MKVDLAPLAHQANARVQIYFDTFDPGRNGFEGVYIDKVKVRNFTER